ncbi:MarR family transcriptional regulator [Colwellia sp. M166]|uniref:MarR family winged helix-turn-helix transcriptional regulator n=1 Tax=Colwellia sp. M166 TaxID=2583805 RepID=UPI00211E9E23|nr:MarR family transcriptional regulator [Colwellia sp. M166]UUO23874.1 MarR family transcriptional regulator [Colwellia sp. M166]|tara:strand:+ start:64291 stop:64740 length:450 start_codon:yes stop_codon:yes gene_type:complete
MTKPDSSSNLTLDKQICFSLYSASNAMARSYQPLLKKLDLTYLQYIVMMVLWQDSIMNVKELGAKVHLDSGTLTPLLKRLEGKGLVIRSRSKADERVRIISLSDAGNKLRQAAEQVPDMMMCKSKMTSEELNNLKQACDLLLKNLTTTD